MKKRMLKLLFELIKNSKRSDREIAKIIGVSQPTVTRMRQRLEKKAIVEYTVIPDWKELGFEIMAFTFVKALRQQGLAEKAREWTMKNPSVVFASEGEGMGMDGVMISFHRDFSGFADFIMNFKREWSEDVQDTQSFLMTTDGQRLIKPLSLKYLEKVGVEGT